MEIMFAQDGDTLFFEDFSNGFEGNNSMGAWSITDNGGNSIWMIADDQSPSGDYSAPWLPLASPTADNGWVIFDADRYNTELGSEPISVGGYLYAPVLDFNDETTIRIEFYQAYVYCCSQNSPLTLEVSSDNGIQWTVWNLGDDIPQGSYEPSANPDKVVRDISCAAAGHSEVLIRWGFNGNLSESYTGFFYGIDDVCIYNSIAEYDLQILHQCLADINNHYEYSLVPNQQNEVTVGLIYRNNGNMSINDVVWSCEYMDENMNVLETFNSDPFNVPSNTDLGTCPSDSMYYRTMNFELPSIEGIEHYFRSTLLFAETDSSPLNNVVTRPIIVDYEIWGHVPWNECDTIISSFETIEDASVFPPYGVGTTFFSNDDVETCGVWVKFGEVDYTEFSVFVMDLFDGFNYDNLLSVEWFYMDGSNLGNDGIIYLPLNDMVEIEGIPILIAVVSEAEMEGYFPVAASSNSNWDNSSWQYRRMPDGEYQWDQGAGWTPAIAIDTSPCLSVFENDEIEQIQNLNLSPVPADQMVHVQFDLNKSDVAAYIIRDVSGRRIDYLNLGRLNSGLNSFDINVSDLASGTYILTIVLANGAHVEKAMVVGRSASGN